MFDSTLFRKKLRKALGAFDRELKKELSPTSPSEIETLEQKLGTHLQLPQAYEFFLSYIGRNAGSVFDYIGITYDCVCEVEELRELAQNCLTPLGESLPENVMILDAHLGLEFHFIHLNAEEDPPVYLWENGSTGIAGASKQAESISEFILELTTHRAKLLRREKE